MTREKAGLDTRRTIIDLSWPKGLTVNDGVSSSAYLNTDFELKYPSIDLMVNRLNAWVLLLKFSKLISAGSSDMLGLIRGILTCWA